MISAIHRLLILLRGAFVAICNTVGRSRRVQGPASVLNTVLFRLTRHGRFSVRRQEHQASLFAMAVSGAFRERQMTQVRRQRQTALDVPINRVRCVIPKGGSVTACGELLSMGRILNFRPACWLKPKNLGNKILI
jgi:hypothetical protein